MNLEQRVADAWKEAALDLRIRVDAPFELKCEGRRRSFLARLPHFGGGNGVLVALLPEDEEARFDAERAGYRCSFLEAESYETYDRGFFENALLEWGFSGRLEEQPVWMWGAPP